MMAESVKPPLVAPKTVPPPPSPKVVEKTEKELLLEKIQAVLKEFGKESDIPINHDYWQFVNKYRSL
jgi:hypothetical protein